MIDLNELHIEMLMRGEVFLRVTRDEDGTIIDIERQEAS
jgi:hypothetical protein